ncbi:hypothetical protein TNCT_287741 [Trichonephila clavata]|uniref:Uncharacterized protein n=1 Tax=Trichonephila clavata TaxID=2740835 RepID=A0A8X6HCP2_TRICU|nr:hypothetical protein TNCT_287741 [Trichonephila clavata]
MNSEKQMLQTHQKTGCFLSRRVIDTHVTGRPVQVPRIDQWDGRKKIRLARCGACPVNCHAQEVFVLPRRLRGSDIGEDLLKGGEHVDGSPVWSKFTEGDGW